MCHFFIDLVQELEVMHSESKTVKSVRQTDREGQRDRGGDREGGTHKQTEGGQMDPWTDRQREGHTERRIHG